MTRRVAVTGIGVVSALGTNAATFWQSLTAGRSGIRPLSGFRAGEFRFANAAEVLEFDSSQHFGDKQAAMLDRSAQLALVAAREAVADSGTETAGPRTAVVTGSCIGGQPSMDEAFVDVYKKGLPRVSPLMIPRVMANAGASLISMHFGITGPSYTVSTACSSANHAIGQAFWLVRSGVVDRAVAGGHEATFSYAFLRAWEAMRVVSPDTCRPFSRDRHGMILGEGAGMLVLEDMEAAVARGARIYAELAGFGMSSDAHHMTQPCAQGAARAMTAALEDAGLAADDIGYINAHGTGTPANDPTETAAIRIALGNAAERVAVSSTKSMHGHALGAAGAIEAAATVLALRHGVLPPTANFTDPDPECDLDVIANTARPARAAAALSNSFAFGGLNAVLAFRAVL
ncbi:MAG TPA: beta-ketoacyl-[acyl-carrier-protein] synthase family protein [Bryobacteraceae bacterium]|nr:beta-ketoacyl-[acyl-carrier-protein] synthase family protein [Bryobacteraceae bacterium]